jgi:hypothetical protein
MEARIRRKKNRYKRNLAKGAGVFLCIPSLYMACFYRLSLLQSFHFMNLWYLHTKISFFLIKNRRITVRLFLLICILRLSHFLLPTGPCKVDNLFCGMWHA